MAKYWLMKSEPDVYSFETLKSEGSTLWTGVRNYQARNYMMKEMQAGDLVLFYHSNAEPPGIAGLAKVSAPAVPDPTQFDSRSDVFDPKALIEKPRWFCVQVQYEKAFKNYVSLHELRKNPKLKDMLVLQKGSRLSVQPVSRNHFELVKTLGGL